MAAVLEVASLHLELDGRFPEKELEAVSMAASERDSGHWSDFVMPFEGLTDEELVSVCGLPAVTTETEPVAVIPPAPPLPPTPHTLQNSWPRAPRGRLYRSQSSLSVRDYDSFTSPRGYMFEYSPPDTPTHPRHTPTHGIRINEDKTCIICFDPEIVEEQDYWNEWDWEPSHQYISSHKKLPCCHRLVCKGCMLAVMQSNVDEGRVAVSCPHPECGKPFNRDYILEHCDSVTKEKFNRFLVDIENDGTRKTCPSCCEITEHTLPKTMRRLQESDLKISCKNCQHEWCFRCHAPWHSGISCRQFSKGNKLFNKWTKGRNDRGVANCQKCPTCLVFIQRSSGCNHMTCNRCDTEFCYYCGNRFLELGIIDHDSTLNVWGCPNNYHPNEPVVRHLVRGGYLTAKISYLAGVPVLFVGACALLVVGGAIVLPIYGSVKLYKLIKYNRSNNRRKRKH